ncbi:hypothetical protein CYMTET_54216 [Cymbomonas tetramitiformis]|uniref:SAM domain-containing protein n=1 Tax=Cymbomonas tetramitiformis TaxID=36881 RepID=A0AAE0BH51_9CHLO|nr:hypothetical protein CYMTET_54216 [Cymbomonas tetramitiformis]
MNEEARSSYRNFLTKTFQYRNEIVLRRQKLCFQFAERISVDLAYRDARLMSKWSAEYELPKKSEVPKRSYDMAASRSSPPEMNKYYREGYNAAFASRSVTPTVPARDPNNAPSPTYPSQSATSAASLASRFDHSPQGPAGAGEASRHYAEPGDAGRHSTAARLSNWQQTIPSAWEADSEFGQRRGREGIPGRAPVAESVDVWLKTLGLMDVEDCIRKFALGQITMEVLPMLQDTDLSELGVALGARKLILHALKQLQPSPSTRPLAGAPQEAGRSPPQTARTSPQVPGYGTVTAAGSPQMPGYGTVTAAGSPQMAWPETLDEAKLLSQERRSPSSPGMLPHEAISIDDFNRGFEEAQAQFDDELSVLEDEKMKVEQLRQQREREERERVEREREHQQAQEEQLRRTLKAEVRMEILESQLGTKGISEMEKQYLISEITELEREDLKQKLEERGVRGGLKMEYALNLLQGGSPARNKALDEELERKVALIHNIEGGGGGEELGAVGSMEAYRRRLKEDYHLDFKKHVQDVERRLELEDARSDNSSDVHSDDNISGALRRLDDRFTETEHAMRELRLQREDEILEKQKHKERKDKMREKKVSKMTKTVAEERQKLRAEVWDGKLDMGTRAEQNRRLASLKEQLKSQQKGAEARIAEEMRSKAHNDLTQRQQAKDEERENRREHWKIIARNVQKQKGALAKEHHEQLEKRRQRHQKDLEMEERIAKETREKNRMANRDRSPALGEKATSKFISPKPQRLVGNAFSKIEEEAKTDSGYRSSPSSNPANILQPYNSTARKKNEIDGLERRLRLKEKPSTITHTTSESSAKRGKSNVMPKPMPGSRRLTKLQQRILQQGAD